MKISTVGLDQAKNLFQIHGVDSQDHIVVRRQLRRTDVLPYFAKLEPCTVGMEACGSSRYWGRELTKLGHTVCLIAQQFVRPYVKSNKTHAAIAEAICEAIQRPNMRLVAVKTQEQQTMLSLHRARAGLVKSRVRHLPRATLPDWSCFCRWSPSRAHHSERSTFQRSTALPPCHAWL